MKKIALILTLALVATFCSAAGAFAAIDPKNDITLYYSQHVLASPFARIRKDCIEAVKLDLGFEAYVSDMWNGKGNALA